MDDKTVRDVFEELLPSLEALDTKCAAILQFLKAKGITNDEELAPYFEQAGNASSVRWRAARVRINHLLSAPPVAEKTEAASSNKTSEKAETSSSNQASDKAKTSSSNKKETEKSSEPAAFKKSTEAENAKAEKDEGDLQKPADNAPTETASNTEPRKESQKESPSPEREDKNAA